MKHRASHSGAEKRPRILAAEDDPVSAQLLKSVLGMHGYDTDVVHDGTEAVERWEAGGYDLIVMDVQMPNLDGLAATRQIREKEQTRGGHIPIIAMTGHNSHEDREACGRAGMDACLSKPVNFEEGSSIIKDLLDKA